MTMLIMEGFEGYEDATDIRRRHQLVASGTPTLVSGRFGGQALRMGTNNILWLSGFGNPSSFVLGFAVRFTGATIASAALVRVFSGVIEHLELRVNVAGKLFVDRGSTNLGESDTPMHLNDWTYIEFKATIADTGSFEVRMDGKTVMSDGSVDTRQGANAEIDLIGIYRAVSQAEEHDDLYLLDDQGLTNTDFLGDIQIETMVPDADGNRNDFTRVGGGLNNFEAVDDGDTPDDDTTYNHSATLDDAELYGHAAMTASFDTVFALQVRNHYRKENAGDRQVRSLIRSNTNEAEGSAKVLSVDWRYGDDIFETDPQGGGAWTETRINALEAGFTIEA